MFTALNTAFTLDGLFMYVPARKIMEKPLHVVNLIDAKSDFFLQPRHLVVFEEGSQARLLESGGSTSDRKTFTNSVAEVFVAPRAVIDM